MVTKLAEQELTNYRVAQDQAETKEALQQRALSKSRTLQKYDKLVKLAHQNIYDALKAQKIVIENKGKPVYADFDAIQEFDNSYFAEKGFKTELNSFDISHYESQFEDEEFKAITDKNAGLTEKQQER